MPFALPLRCRLLPGSLLNARFPPPLKACGLLNGSRQLTGSPVSGRFTGQLAGKSVGRLRLCCRIVFGGCLPEAAKKRASVCEGGWCRAKLLHCPVERTQKYAFVARNYPVVPQPRCSNIHSRAFWQQLTKRGLIWGSRPLGLLLARALGSRGLPLGFGALLAHAAAALSGSPVAVGITLSVRTRLLCLLGPLPGTLLAAVRVCRRCSPFGSPHHPGNRSRLLRQPNVKSSRPARFPDVFLGG